MAFDLEFERPLAEIDKRIQALQRRGEKLRSEDRAQLREAELELDRRIREIYAELTPWQRVLVARHRERQPRRPNRRPVDASHGERARVQDRRQGGDQGLVVELRGSQNPSAVGANGLDDGGREGHRRPGHRATRGGWSG